MTSKETDQYKVKVESKLNLAGDLFISLFHYAALFAIGAIVALAAFMAIWDMFGEKRFDIDGILLLFIYLELGAMVGIYFKTHQMPVRYLIYIAITALTRLLISDVSHHNPDWHSSWKLLMEAGAILLLCFSVLVIRIGSTRYPSKKHDVQEEI